MTYSPSQGAYVGGKVSVDPMALDQAQQEVNQLQSIEDQQKRDEEERRRQEAEAAAKQVEASKPKPGVIQEVGTAAVGGLIDFAEGVGTTFNVPWLNMDDKIEPMNQTQWGKALRGAVELIVPTIAIGAVTKGAGNKLIGAQRAANIAKPVKWLGEAGIDAAAGLAVDSVSQQSYDSNLAGMLKPMMPWIPDSIATLDTDSPEVMREKNQKEGVGLGFAIDVLSSGVRFVRSLRGLSNTTTIKPKSPAAKAFDDEVNAKKTPSTPEDDLIKGTEARDKVTLDHAKHQIDTVDPDGVEPHFAVNGPIYDLNEKAVITAGDDAVRQSDIAAARIKYNIDTTDGSLPAITDSATIKRTLDTEDPLKRSIAVGLRDTRMMAGEYSAKTANGKDITAAMIKSASEDDLLALLKPGMTDDFVPKLKQYFAEDRLTTAWGNGTYADLTKSATGAKITKFIRDNFGIESLKASGRVQRTLARQVADIATAAKTIGDTMDVTRQQEIMIDALQVLARENAISSYAMGRGLQLWGVAVKQASNLKGGGDAMKEAVKEAEVGMRQAISKADEAINSIREVSKSNPEMAKALLYAYEATGGNVTTVNALNQWYRKSTGILSKAVFDGDPEVPSVVMQGIWSTIYNSILSATVTPLRAWAGNTVGMLLKPTTLLVGSALRGDAKTFKRGLVQYGALNETLQKSYEHFSLVLRRLQDDPDSVRYAVRDDIVTQNNQIMETLEQYAKAKESEGEAGPMVMFQTARILRDFNNHPLVRYSANAMGAGDAFTRAFMSNVEARGRAYDELVQSGKPINAENMQAAQKKLYSQMFDSDGLIKDEVVDYTSREIAMNLDTPLSSGLSQLINRVPALRPFMMFPRTSMNILSFTNKHSPLARWVGESGKILDMAKMRDPGEIDQFMRSRGYSTYSEADFDSIVAETRGRIAIGDMTVMGAVGLYLSGKITGNGPYERKQREAWTKNNWAPRSFKINLPGGGEKYISYDGLEPFATFFSLIADIGDNSTSIGQAPTEDLYRKLAYAFSMNITNKSFLSGLAPMTDMLSGNEAGFNRFIANQANSLIPFASARNQLSQLMAPGLREVEDDVFQLIRNRNNYLDLIDPNGALPFQKDYMDGSKIRDHDPLTNFLNVAQPFKLNPTAEPYRQWLIDTGFDTLPILNKDRFEGEFTPKQRSELGAIMGETGNIKRRIEKLMVRPDIIKDLQFVEEQRAKGRGSETVDISNSRTHTALREIFTSEKRSAEAILYSRYPDLRQRGNLKSIQEKNQKAGNYAAVEAIINLRNGK